MAAECLWTEDENGCWWTTCGEGHEFTTGGPAENRHSWCPYCGRALKHFAFREPEVGDDIPGRP